MFKTTLSRVTIVKRNDFLMFNHPLILSSSTDYIYKNIRFMFVMFKKKMFSSLICDLISMTSDGNRKSCSKK